MTKQVHSTKSGEFPSDGFMRMVGRELHKSNLLKRRDKGTKCEINLNYPNFFFFFFFCFFGLYPRHGEVPKLGVESELELPAYTTDIATKDPSHTYGLHHSSQQRQILVRFITLSHNRNFPNVFYTGISKSKKGPLKVNLLHK